MKRFLLAALGGLTMATFSAHGFNLGQGGHPGQGGVEAAISPFNAPQALAVPIVDVDAPAFAVRRFVGQVEPVRTVDIAFQVSGQITDLLPEEGARIAAGTAVARLDPDDYRMALERAQAVLALSEAEYARILELVERNVVPVAQLERARAELRQAEVAVDQATRHLGQTVIHAPFEALLARRFSEKWTNVTPEVPVLRLQDVTELLVTISLPEAMAMQARSAADAFEAMARFPALPDLELPLKLVRFVTEADPVAQTYAVKLALQELDDRILPGMTATVEVRIPAAQGEFLVPVSSVDTTSDAEPRVWVVDANGTASPRRVTLGLPQGERIEVLEGLAPGERIVAAGWRQLRDGARVEPAEI